MKGILFTILAACGGSLVAGVGTAEVLEFQFAGTVTYGGDLATVGNRIDGAFSYDTSTVLHHPGHATYSFASPFTLSASVAGHTISTGNMTVFISDNFGGNVEDSISIYSYSPSVDQATYPQGSFGLQLASGPGNTDVLFGTALPTFFDVVAFDAGPTLNYGWLQRDGSQTGTLLQFSIDSIAVAAPVPVPPGIVLLASGLLACIALRRKDFGGPCASAYVLG